MALDDTIPCGSESSGEDISTTDESKDSPELQGPFHGLVSFIQEQHKLFAENQDPWSIKSNKESLTYEVLGHQGKGETHRLRFCDTLRPCNWSLRLTLLLCFVHVALDALPFPKVVYK